MERLKALVTSKTVWGAILASGAWFASQPRITALNVVQALAQVLIAVGVRDAVRSK